MIDQPYIPADDASPPSATEQVLANLELFGYRPSDR